MERGVLVVDDDPEFLDAVSQILSGLGYSVSCARDGEEAIALLHRSAANPPGLVLLDVRMPKLDGETVRAWIKAVPSMAEVPVVLVSGHPLDGQVHEPFEGFVRKPFDLETLLTMATRFCGVAAALPELAPEGPASGGRAGPSA